MTDARRAAILAAVSLVAFACMLILLSLLARCAMGDEGPAFTPEVPATTPEVPEGRSPYTGLAARLPQPESAASPLRPAPGGALLGASVFLSALPQSKDAFRVPAEHPAVDSC